MDDNAEKFIALSGGVGGAKLVLGLSHVLDTSQLTVVANTGDDFEHLGLNISPDIDTLIYTLANIGNTALGWGREDETWNFMDAAGQLGLQTWFRLGDRDLALHLYRTNRLKQNASLSEVTSELTSGFNVQTELVPMSDDPVRTVLETGSGRIPFQEYFVKHQCTPVVSAVHYPGAEKARPSPVFSERLQATDLRAVIICPSNPFLSVNPILSLTAVKSFLKQHSRPVIVVSPVRRGQSFKGPTTKIMRELGLGTDVTAIAEIYREIADGIVIDTEDADCIDSIEAMGLAVHSTGITMNTLQDRINLAGSVIDFTRTFRR